MDRFLVDHMCGRLARYLRFCGHDAAYAGDHDLDEDATMRAMAQQTDRIIISRDRELCNRAPDAICIESREIEDQLREVAAAGVSLTMADEPTRCGSCNGPLRREESSVMVPEHVPDDLSSPLYRCQRCEQLFWKGSHWERVGETLDQIRTAMER